ncbi:sorting nexin-12 isoform X2 [Grus americana]|uniref:sorting nexin-12 isoform X2 n=1 Tax=Grus americana TaxID=9117 RepID=UPI002407D94E|nr:sorting nexin-12 isoform X2 [Grus americana]
MQVPGLHRGVPPTLDTHFAYAGGGRAGAVACVGVVAAEGPRTLDTFRVMQATGGQRCVVRGWGGLRQRAGRGGGGTTMSEAAVADTRRLNTKPQDLTDAYGPPSNFLEIDIFNPQTVGMGRARYTSYELRMRTNLPIFKLKESCVRRRYSDFEWLKNELERDSKIVVPPLPGKALKRQLPFRGDEGIFEESFIEERRQGLEQFINK